MIAVGPCAMLSPAMYSTTKRILVGKPIASAEEQHQRLRKIIALPVFASDAISSTAYATDEILVVLLIQAWHRQGGLEVPRADRADRLRAARPSSS